LPQAPPKTPPPPFAAAAQRPSHHSLAHAPVPTEARHQHDIACHPNASEQHLPPSSVGYALSSMGSMPNLSYMPSRGRTFCSMHIRVIKQHKTEAKKHFGCFRISIVGLQQYSSANEIQIAPDQNSKQNGQINHACV